MHGHSSGSAALRRRTAPPRAPRGGGRPGWRLGVLLGVCSALGLLGCKDLTGSQALPAGTVNPAFYRTPSGAYGMRTQALYSLSVTLPSYLVASGLLTDELESSATGMTALNIHNPYQPERSMLDARVLPELGYGGGASPADVDYLHLQRARAELSQAAGALAAYDTGAHAIGAPTVLRAEMAALTGYTEILLADLFCSGIPLSTLDFQGDYTYHAADSTAQVYRAAIAHEDQALTLAGTDPSIASLARVLKGRALLALDSVAAAAQVVAPVPDGFAYTIGVNFQKPTPDASFGTLNALNAAGTVSDHEGQTGLPYTTAHDPRTKTTIVIPANVGYYENAVALTFPAKFSPTTYSAFPIADAVEARLIQAEAALRAGEGTWLGLLNGLRTNGTSTTDSVPADTLVDTLGYTGCTLATPCLDGGYAPGIDYSQWTLLSSSYGDVPYGGPQWQQCVDIRNETSFWWVCASPTINVYVSTTLIPLVLWHAGSGGVAGLGPLADPGANRSGTAADSARVALLFQERAFWLFLTGHRQGDFRRLLRSPGYRRWFTDQAQVYPTGAYPAPAIGPTAYGSDVTAPIPGTEYLNPLFHGCYDRKP